MLMAIAHIIRFLIHAKLTKWRTFFGFFFENAKAPIELNFWLGMYVQYIVRILVIFFYMNKKSQLF